jgi:hypothetical protein
LKDKSELEKEPSASMYVPVVEAQEDSTFLEDKEAALQVDKVMVLHFHIDLEELNKMLVMLLMLSVQRHQSSC